MGDTIQGMSPLEQAFQIIYTFPTAKNTHGDKRYFHQQRVQYLLEKLGNPQNSLNVINVVGTSGKGTTAFALATALESQGFNVGLTMSPWLVDIRERALINREYIDEQKYLDYVLDCKPVWDEAHKSPFGKPSFFEVFTVLAYYIFAKESVDYAVIEANAGGLHDLTNINGPVKRHTIITTVGFDHEKMLGSTLEEITAMKAGMIADNASVTFAHQSDPITEIIRFFARLKKAEVNAFDYTNTVSDIGYTDEGLSFTYHGKQEIDLSVSTKGNFYIKNIVTALKSLEFLSERDSFLIDSDALRSSLKNLRVIGRFDEINYKGKTLILDAAHNPQKMQALVAAYRQSYDVAPVVIFAAKKGKDVREMLQYVFEIADTVFLTEFTTVSEYSVTPYTVHELQSYCENFQNVRIVTEPDPLKAIQEAMDESKPVLITGSMYLLSQVYRQLDEL